MKSRLYSALGFSTVCLPLFLAGNVRADDAELKSDLPPTNSIWLETLNLKLALSKMGDPRPARSYYGQPITLSSGIYPHGVGLSGEAEMSIDLHGNALEFQAQVGVDDEVKNGGDISFTVLVDDKIAFESGEMHGGDASKFVKVDLTGAKELMLRVAQPGTIDYGNNADWAGAFIRLKPKTRTMPTMKGPALMATFPALLPPDPKPAINGPEKLGFSPNKPFLYRIPATGAGTLVFTATGLPTGLSLDSKTGIISGQVEAEGTSIVVVTAANAAGKTQKTLTLVCGPNTLALTPPMGWSAYELFGDSNSDAKVREAAQWLVKSGLAAHGYRTLLVGDAWQGKRDENGDLQPNVRFPDMKALGDYLHSLGLQFGLHSAGSEHTAVGSPGSLGHEEQDAAQFAAWGVDYLTYEWAPKPDDAHPMPLLEDKEGSAKAIEKSFGDMSEALRKTDRDIVLSVSLPSMDAIPFSDRLVVAPLAKKVGAQVWSERNGLYDNWKWMSDLASAKIGAWVPVQYEMGFPPQPQAGAVAGTSQAGTLAIGGLARAMTRMITPRTAVAAPGGATAPTGKSTETDKATPASPAATGTAPVIAPLAVEKATTPAAPTTSASAIPTAPKTAIPAAQSALAALLAGGMVGGSNISATPQKILMPKPIPEAAPGPGFWTYSGALLSGRMGYPDLRLSRLSPGEQMYQMSIWSLLSSPLILKADLARLDPNLLSPTTTAILSNDEVISIDQDALASAPVYIASVYRTTIRSKVLADGRIAVGFFNATEMPRNMRVNWKTLALEGPQPVRDVWAHQDKGELKDGYDVLVPAHGVVLIKVGKAKVAN